MSYRIGVYAAATEKAISKVGFDTIFTEPEESYIRDAREAGLIVYACIWTFKAPRNDPKLGVESVTGRRMLWAGAGCPNNPEVRGNSRRLVEEAASLEVDGIVLDAARFPSAGSGVEAFLSCFCPSCKEKARELGYNLEPVKAYLKNFQLNFEEILRSGKAFTELLQATHEGLVQWLGFRAASINGAVEDLKEGVKSLNPSLEFGAALFTPSLAPLVGQDYTTLSQIYDFVQPMLYHRGEGIACINYELASLARIWPHEKQGQILTYLYRMLSYEKFNPPLKPAELERSGLPQYIVDVELRRVKRLVWSSITTPILWVVGLNVEEVERLMKLASSSKPHGLVLFNYQEGMSLPASITSEINAKQ